jgi:hypothetical protein
VAQVATGARRSLAPPCRQALPCFAFLHRCHPVGPGDRCGRCQTHLAHIRPDGFARHGRRLGPVDAMRASQYGVRGSDENNISSAIFIGLSFL